MSRQNVYDDGSFFSGYQQMRDAESGINAAVEQPGLRALLPDPAGRAVLDLGCGDGTLARDLLARGAAQVLGADPSARMLALARARSTDPRVRYVQAFAEDLSLRPTSVDLVVSSLALHYVADLGTVGGDEGVEGHVLGLEGRDPDSLPRQPAAQPSGEHALSGVRGGPGDEQAALHGRILGAYRWLAVVLAAVTPRP